MVISGDLTQRARRAQFDQARAFIDRLPTTILTVMGNHDLPLVNLPRRLLTGTRRYERSITGDLDPVVAVEGLVAVGLDTMPSWRWKAGHVSPRQVAIGPGRAGERSTRGLAAVGHPPSRAARPSVRDSSAAGGWSAPVPRGRGRTPAVRVTRTRRPPTSWTSTARRPPSGTRRRLRHGGQQPDPGNGERLRGAPTGWADGRGGRITVEVRDSDPPGWSAGRAPDSAAHRTGWSPAGRPPERRRLRPPVRTSAARGVRRATRRRSPCR